MIWKIYKLMAMMLVQSERNDLLTQINRLHRVISCIREYYGLHPAFAATTYGTLGQYLKQRLPEQDLVLLNQLRVIDATHSSCAPSAVLDIA